MAPLPTEELKQKIKTYLQKTEEKEIISQEKFKKGTLPELPTKKRVNVQLRRLNEVPDSSIPSTIRNTDSLSFLVHGVQSLSHLTMRQVALISQNLVPVGSPLPGKYVLLIVKILL